VTGRSTWHETVAASAVVRLGDDRAEEVLVHRRREAVELPTEEGQVVGSRSIWVEGTSPSMSCPPVGFESDPLLGIGRIDERITSIWSHDTMLEHRLGQSGARVPS
jgi:hypothetical protein